MPPHPLPQLHVFEPLLEWLSNEDHFRCSSTSMDWSDVGDEESLDDKSLKDEREPQRVRKVRKCVGWHSRNYLEPPINSKVCVCCDYVMNVHGIWTLCRPQHAMARYFILLMAMAPTGGVVCVVHRLWAALCLKLWPILRCGALDLRDWPTIQWTSMSSSGRRNSTEVYQLSNKDVQPN